MKTMRPDYRRAGEFCLLLLLINVVSDGFSGRPTGIAHQLLLLPVTAAFLLVFVRFIRPPTAERVPGLRRAIWTPQVSLVIAVAFQIISACGYYYQARHFARMGYRLHSVLAPLLFGLMIVSLLICCVRQSLSAWWVLFAALGSYVGSILLAVVSFPLNYLRSDMLPVILWADTNLLHHISPYQTMYVGGRVYDFPYLPGMLVSYLPAVALGIDLRICSMLCVAASACLIFATARKERQTEVAALLAVFLTCPYLQYRHEIYSQPYWLVLVIAFVLAQRGKFVMASAAFGVSMAIYQFSWIIFPFFLLYALRRKGWLEVAKLAVASVASALLIVGPFLSSAYKRIASNTVGQWGLRAHAYADPINLSYWITYVIRPGHLLRLQAVVLVAIFGYCFFARQCQTFADALRWMVVTLTVFILLNILVDGYFYLMLLVPMLVYACVANGWWQDFEKAAPSQAT